MKEIIEAIYEQGMLRLPRKLSAPEGSRIWVTLESLKCEVEPVEKTTKYDFSDLIGKLSWQDDALAEQRRMRDEWS